MGARLELHHDRTPGGYDQISLQVVDDTEIGHGYRLLGPKHIGNSVPVAKHTLSQRDADEIRGLLDDVFPPSPQPAARPRSCPNCHSPGQVILGPFDDQRCNDPWHGEQKASS